MALETFNYIDSLVTTNPTATDNVSQGDDHLRGIKTTLKNTFPNVTGAINATQAEVDILDGATVTTAELNILDGVTATTTELNYTDGVTSNIQTQIDGKEAADATILKDADIGVNVQAYSAYNLISNPTGVTGADQVTNVMSLTQAEYDAITPNASTFYIIVG